MEDAVWRHRIQTILKNIAVGSDKSYCVAESGLRIKEGFVHRCVFVFEEKDTWAHFLSMGRNQKRKSFDDIEEKENIHVS